MFADSFYAIGNGVAASLKKYGTRFLRSEIVEYLSGHDIVFCNLECVLSNINKKTSRLRSLHMRANPKAACYLANWSITVVNVANNHILEHGRDCAVDTVNRLRSAGIKIVGAGRKGTFERGLQRAELVINNQTVTVLAICLLKEKYAFDGGAKLNEFLREVHSLSGQNKFTIVSVHWGDELIDRPGALQLDIGQQFLNAGANLVIGHHPHVPQGVEHRDGGLIAYSLGNFIFDSFLKDTNWSYILTVRVSGKEITEWNCIPVEKDDDHRPRFAEGKKKYQLEQEIRRRCELLNSKTASVLYEQKYYSDFKALDLSARYKLWLHLLKKMPEVNFVFWPQILLRPLQRRLGLW